MCWQRIEMDTGSYYGWEVYRVTRRLVVAWIAQAGVNFFIDGQRLKLISKCVVPFGGGNINGIRNIAGGLGLASFDNNASFVTELQVMF
jgi:hypothetical protein